jgi:hypothetical protein
MADIQKTERKQPKIPRRVMLFLKNIANGMSQTESYLLAGFKAKTYDSAAQAASRLSRHLQETMTARDTLDIMVPDKDLFAIVNEKMLTAPDDVQVRAASLFGKWKGLESPDQAALTGSTIIIMQQLKDGSSEAIDVTPDNDKLIKRNKLVE